MDQFSVYGLAPVPVVVGLAELLKRAGVPKSLIPAVSIVLGLLFAFFYLAPGNPKKAILMGLVLGLSSIGLFSGAKNTYTGIKNRKL